MNPIGYGKCLLAGEHTVLRGGQALVCPLRGITVTCDMNFPHKGVWARQHNQIYPFPHAKLLLDFLYDHKKKLSSGILFEINIPMGMGLGGSAALSVAVAKALGLAVDQDIFEFAVKVEHLFHGVSSGVDVAGSLARKPTLYQGGSCQRQEIDLTWRPFVFLSSTGEVGHTKEAIQSVSHFRETHKTEAEKIDEEMKEACHMVATSLQKVHSQELIAEGFEKAARCFEAWSLITPRMKSAIQNLHNSGARSVKPTGSGLGGMLLSLWDDLPSKELNLMPVFSVENNL